MCVRKLIVVGLLGIAGTLLLAHLLSLQLAPLPSIGGSNPPVMGAITAPANIEAILRRSCYDCHSNETRWPWYSRVAPVARLLAHEVELGRKEVNFSEWTSYVPATRKRKLQWMERSLHERTMPPWTYRLLHPDARLTDKDLTMLAQWIQSQLAALQQPPQTQVSS
jgi:hypothetical protein